MTDMDHNVTRTHTSLALVVALLDQLRTKGTLTDQDLDDILAMAPTVVRDINPSFNNHKDLAESIEVVRQTLG
jgi:hypothetical protein